MSASTENKSQGCKYCKTSIFWDLTIQEKRKWRETISKEVHTFDKCKKIQEEPQAEQSSKPNENTTEYSRVNADSVRTTALINLEIIHIYEQTVRSFLAEHGEKDPNPEKVGLYVKLLMERESKK